MKKFLLSLVLLLISASFVSAQSGLSAADIQSQIENLMKQIELLQKKLAEAQAQQQANPPFCYNWERNLTVGNRGEDVDALVKALIREGVIANPSNENILGEDFNEQLAAAVVKFQEKYKKEILTPSGLKNGTGYVGPSTRAQLNRLYHCVGENAPNPGQPWITILSPNGGENLSFGNLTVKWNATNVSGKVIVYLQFPDGALCKIGSSDAKKGEDLFSVIDGDKCDSTHSIASGQYKVAVFADQKDPPRDYSDNLFILSSQQNPLISKKTETYGSVKVDIDQYQSNLKFEELQLIVKSYDSGVWNKELLGAPAYPPLYKLSKKSNTLDQVAIWYSNSRVIKVSGLGIFIDGSAEEDVLEKQAEIYPSTVNPGSSSNPKPITILSPNGGEVLLLESIFNVKNSYDDLSKPMIGWDLYKSDVKLGYLDGAIITSDQSVKWNVGKYVDSSGQIKTAEPSSDYFIVLYTPGNSKLDISDAAFTITNKLSITASRLGDASGRPLKDNDDVGALTFKAGAQKAVVKSVTLHFKGDALANSALPKSIRLVDSENGGHWADSLSKSCVSDGEKSCSVKIGLDNASITANTSKVINIRIDSSKLTKTSAVDSLSVSMIAATDLIWTEGGVEMNLGTVPFDIVSISY